MYKILTLLTLIIFLSCNKNSEKIKENIFISEKIEKKLKPLKDNLLNIYSRETNINYEFIGDLTLENTVLIDGKDIIIPIYPQKNGKEIIMNIGIVYNIKTNKSQVLVDSLFLDLKEFQKIIFKSEDWVKKMKGVDFGKNILEKKLFNDPVEIKFPQGKKKKFTTIMRFNGKTDKQYLILIEKTDKNPMTITFNEYEIDTISKGLKNEKIEYILLENMEYLEKEVENLKKDYEKLNKVLQIK